MIVRSIGNSLMVILPDLVSKKITNWFDLVRPMIAFKFQTVRVFEMKISLSYDDGLAHLLLFFCSTPPQRTLNFDYFPGG